MMSALSLAIPYESVRVVKGIVGRMRRGGVDERLISGCLELAATCAVKYGYLTPLRALVEEGVDMKSVRSTSKAGPEQEHSGIKMGLLNVAVQAGQEREMLDFLIEQGCDPLTYNDDTGCMAHHVAATNGRTALLEWFLARFSIPVDAETDDGTTALYCAAHFGYMDTVRFLIGAGVDPRRRQSGEYRLLPSEAAERNGHTDIAAYLREQEATAVAAETAAQAEQEVARRRARNEKRRQKQKKAKARRAAAQQQQESDEEGEDGAGAAAAAAAGGAGGGQEEQEQEEQEQGGVDLEEGWAWLESLGVGVGQQQQEQQEQQLDEEQQVQAQQSDDEQDQELLADAIALSLAPAAPAAVRPPPLDEYVEAGAPDHLQCPIALALFNDPVLLPADGCTYSRAAIETHFDACRKKGKPLTAPKTNLEITDPTYAMLFPNVMARSQVLEYKEAKTREWEAAERAWQQKQAQEQEA